MYVCISFAFIWYPFPPPYPSNLMFLFYFWKTKHTHTHTHANRKWYLTCISQLLFSMGTVLQCDWYTLSAYCRKLITFSQQVPIANSFFGFGWEFVSTSLCSCWSFDCREPMHVLYTLSQSLWICLFICSVMPRLQYFHELIYHRRVLKSFHLFHMESWVLKRGMRYWNPI